MRMKDSPVTLSVALVDEVGVDLHGTNEKLINGYELREGAVKNG
jgi:hypothetical protein